MKTLMINASINLEVSISMNSSLEVLILVLDTAASRGLHISRWFCYETVARFQMQATFSCYSAKAEEGNMACFHDTINRK